jgi:predicted RNA-binding Zn ribbon-like protein
MNQTFEITEDGTLVDRIGFDRNLFRGIRKKISQEMNGQIRESLSLGAAWSKIYAVPICYSAVQFLRSPRNRKLIHQCTECGKYFISETVRAQRFCPGGTCKDAYHNRRRIESGEARRYKRMRHAQGLDQ